MNLRSLIIAKNNKRKFSRKYPRVSATQYDLNKGGDHGQKTIPSSQSDVSLGVVQTAGFSKFNIGKHINTGWSIWKSTRNAVARPVGYVMEKGSTILTRGNDMIFHPWEDKQSIETFNKKFGPDYIDEISIDIEVVQDFWNNVIHAWPGSEKFGFWQTQ